MVHEDSKMPLKFFSVCVVDVNKATADQIFSGLYSQETCKSWVRQINILSIKGKWPVDDMANLAKLETLAEKLLNLAESTAIGNSNDRTLANLQLLVDTVQKTIDNALKTCEDPKSYGPAIGHLTGSKRSNIVIPSKLNNEGTLIASTPREGKRANFIPTILTAVDTVSSTINKAKQRLNEQSTTLHKLQM